jgi:lysophospholipid acyltransferase (LPLAT)-like uncharacterized protein
LTEGLKGNKDVRLSQNDMRGQLQDKMAQGLLEIAKEQGHKILRLWKERSNVFVEIRDLNVQTWDEYLSLRTVDAGCP